MSIWDEHQVEDRVREVLAAVHVNTGEGHALGRPHLTAYQLAVALDARHPSIRQELGVPIGGRGTGTGRSFAQYLAGELSRRLGRGVITDVEGGFLSNENLVSLEVTGGIHAAFTGNQNDLSLFRLAN